jgi:hypothetical protein
MKLRAPGRVGFLYELKFPLFTAASTSRSDYSMGFASSRTVVRASRTTIDGMAI